MGKSMDIRHKVFPNVGRCGRIPIPQKIALLNSRPERAMNNNGHFSNTTSSIYKQCRSKHPSRVVNAPTLPSPPAPTVAPLASAQPLSPYQHYPPQPCRPYCRCARAA